MLAGCQVVPNKPYHLNRGVLDSEGKPVPAGVVLPSGNEDANREYELVAIEFDAQGEKWSDTESADGSGTQLETAKRIIRDSEHPPLLLVFVHGWHNNASPGNRDLASFKNLLSQVAAIQRGKQRRSVIGVYIGWRGLAWPHELDVTGVGKAMRYLSFWNKKAETDRVSGLPLTSTLAELSATARARGRKARVIFAGHSFGGRILELSVNEAMMGQKYFSEDGNIRPVADLVILLNSASEASFARQMRQEVREFETGRPPLIVSLTSRNDSATGLAWPIGTKLESWLSPSIGSFRRYSDGRAQDSFIGKTAGHHEALVNYSVIDEKSADPSADFMGFQSVEGTSRAFLWNVENARQRGYFWTDLGKEGKERLKAWRLVPVKDSDQGKGGRAYRVVAVDPQIWPGHGIFSGPVNDMLAAIYDIYQLEEKASSRDVLKLQAPVQEDPR